MKITMYELLGMVKDGKTPKKILFGNIVYEYFEDKKYKDYRYKDEKTDIYGYLSSYIEFNGFDVLNTEVEILEEEKKIPEKLETYKEVDDEDSYANILKVSKNGEYEIDEATSVIVDKINEIIDCLDYLKSKGE